MHTEQQEERHFGQRLRQLREEAGLSQAELWDRAGVSRGTGEKIEAGITRSPGWDQVLRFARALGVTPDAFLHPGELSQPNPPRKYHKK